MITRFGIAPRKTGMSASDFQAHWRGPHARVVRDMQGLTRYWQNHAVLREGEPLLPWPGFDACAQFGAEKLTDFDRAFSSEHYLGPVRDDEPNFVDNSKGGSMLCERILAKGDVGVGSKNACGESGVRLMTFMRLAPMASLTTLGTALVDAPLSGSACGREVFLALTSGQRFSVFEALEILLFTNADEALQHVCSAKAREQHADLAGLIRGTERLIARVNVVI